MTATREFYRPAERVVPARGAHASGWSLRRSALALSLAAGLGCGLLPLAETLGREEPWMASVRLTVADSSGKITDQALAAARKQALSRDTAGRAVDLIGLDADPDYGASSPSGLEVAYEILAGDGGGSADARSRAIDAVLANLKLEASPDKQGLTLYVKSADSDKAVKIAEALATSYSAAGEITGSITPSADKIRQDTAAKAASDLAAYRSQIGPDKLATAEVMKKRIDELDRQIADRKAQVSAGTPGEGLLKASLNDVLSGRVAGGIEDPALEQARQDYLTARMAYDQLAASLGPKHPRLLAARSDVEAARTALSTQFTRSKQQAARAEAEEKQALADLVKEWAATADKLKATGVDFARLATLEAAAEAAHSALDDITTGSIPKTLLHYSADQPKPIADTSDNLLWVKVFLSGLVGFAAVYGGFYFRKRMLAVPAGEDGRSDERPYEREAADEQEQRPSRFEPRHRHHRAANRYFGGDEADPAYEEDDAGFASHRPPVWQARARRRVDEVPTVEKLRRIAPHVFDDPHQDLVSDEEAEVERLRIELQALRQRVLTRAVRGY